MSSEKSGDGLLWKREHRRKRLSHVFPFLTFSIKRDSKCERKTKVYYCYPWVNYTSAFHKKGSNMLYTRCLSWTRHRRACNKGVINISRTSRADLTLMRLRSRIYFSLLFARRYSNEAKIYISALFLSVILSLFLVLFNTFSAAITYAVAKDYRRASRMCDFSYQRFLAYVLRGYDIAYVTIYVGTEMLCLCREMLWYRAREKSLIPSLMVNIILLSSKESST